jgi:hypothetical protein
MNFSLVVGVVVHGTTFAHETSEHQCHGIFQGGQTPISNGIIDLCILFKNIIEFKSCRFLT